jgi:molybdopterin converting factor small subunit
VVVVLKFTARYYGFFSTITRKLHEPLEISDHCSVNDLIDKLTGIYGFKFRKLCFIRPLYSEKDYINVYINTQDINNPRIFPDGLNTAIKEGDIVTFGAVGGAA